MPATTNSPPSLRLVDVTGGYVRDSPIISHADLALAHPGLVHLRGPNGSGKSTFGELVSGYLRPWSGHVLVNGHAAGDRAARASRRVCRAEPALFPAMTVHDHIVLTSRARGIGPEFGFRRAAALGLEPWLGKNAASLSTGTAKKLWYVMCTLGHFTVAVLDEPFNGVDAGSAEVMAGEMVEWSDAAIVVLIAHALEATLPVSRAIDISELGAATRQTP